MNQANIHIEQSKEIEPYRSVLENVAQKTLDQAQNKIPLSKLDVKFDLAKDLAKDLANIGIAEDRLSWLLRGTPRYTSSGLLAIKTVLWRCLSPEM